MRRARFLNTAEFPFTGSSSYYLYLMEVLSRGTIYLNQSDRYAEPILDYRSLSNPLDEVLIRESLKFARRYHKDSETVQTAFAPVEALPGANFTGADLDFYIRNTTTSTAGHMSGTCSMMPRHLGGVVDADLLVYGMTGLSVADASIMPLVPGARTCATVYAVAEKVRSECPPQLPIDQRSNLSYHGRDITRVYTRLHTNDQFCLGCGSHQGTPPKKQDAK